MMQALSSFTVSVLTRATGRNIPEDVILQCGKRCDTWESRGSVRTTVIWDITRWRGVGTCRPKRTVSHATSLKVLNITQFCVSNVLDTLTGHAMRSSHTHFTPYNCKYIPDYSWSYCHHNLWRIRPSHIPSKLNVSQLISQSQCGSVFVTADS
jgi:hypothetical protein